MTFLTVPGSRSSDLRLGRRRLWRRQVRAAGLRDGVQPVVWQARAARPPRAHRRLGPVRCLLHLRAQQRRCVDCWAVFTTSCADSIYVEPTPKIVCALLWQTAKYSLSTCFISGVYSIVMTVSDVAGNSAQARTVLFMDPHNNIQVSRDRPISVQQGVTSDTGMWIPATGELDFDWSGVLSNMFHVNNHFMKEVDRLHDTLDDVLTDDGNITLNSVLNTDGMTHFEVFWNRDSDTSFVLLDPPQLTQLSFSPDRDDGDVISLVVQGYDLSGHFKVRFVGVYVINDGQCLMQPVRDYATITTTQLHNYTLYNQIINPAKTCCCDVKATTGPPHVYTHVIIFFQNATLELRVDSSAPVIGRSVEVLRNVPSGRDDMFYTSK